MICIYCMYICIYSLQVQMHTHTTPWYLYMHMDVWTWPEVTWISRALGCCFTRMFSNCMSNEICIYLQEPDTHTQDILLYAAHPMLRTFCTWEAFGFFSYLCLVTKGYPEVAFSFLTAEHGNAPRSFCPETEPTFVGPRLSLNWIPLTINIYGLWRL